jgi:WD40 repeat protein
MKNGTTARKTKILSSKIGYGSLALALGGASLFQGCLNSPDTPSPHETPNTVSALVSTQATSGMLYQWWDSIPGTSVANLTANVRYPDQPNGKIVLDSGFEAKSNRGNNYGAVMSGWILAPKTGNYTFWIASNDNGEFWLSTTESKTNTKLVASVTGYTKPRQWGKYPSQKSVAIKLDSGKYYYAEALQKDATGGDCLAVGWQLPNGTLEQPIPRNRLSQITVVQPPTNIAPRVHITAPVFGKVIKKGDTLLVTATASDSDGFVAKVTFSRDGKVIATDTTAPYAYTFRDTTVGNHTIRAQATDNKGAVANDSVNYSVQTTLPPPVNLAPWVRITAPTFGKVIKKGDTLLVTATASDSDGFVAKVTFSRDGKVIATDTSAPYAYNFRDTAVGSHTIRAMATDNQGAVANDSVNYSVQTTLPPPANIAPWVRITAPTFGKVIKKGDTLLVTATASDSDGFVAKVTFSRDGKVIATDTSAPYAYTFRDTTLGNHTIRAQATDNKGAVANDSVNYSVQTTLPPPTNIAPRVQITAPTFGKVIKKGDTLLVTATASDSDGFVSKVTFSRDGKVIATDSTAPYTYTFRDTAVGTHTIRAQATDDKGAVANDTVNYSVQTTLPPPVNIAPRVHLTAPTLGKVIKKGDTLWVSATASDSDGFVAKVTFSRDGKVIATDSTAPYTYTFRDTTVGNHTIKAQATDNKGAVANDSVNYWVQADTAAVGLHFKIGAKLNGYAVNTVQETGIANIATIWKRLTLGRFKTA